MLKIHETTTARGEISPVFLRHEEGVLAITMEGTAFALPEGALDAVMARAIVVVHGCDVTETRVRRAISRV